VEARRYTAQLIPGAVDKALPVQHNRSVARRTIRRRNAWTAGMEGAGGRRLDGVPVQSSRQKRSNNYDSPLGTTSM